MRDRALEEMKTRRDLGLPEMREGLGERAAEPGRHLLLPVPVVTPERLVGVHPKPADKTGIVRMLEGQTEGRGGEGMENRVQLRRRIRSVRSAGIQKPET